ncbi:transposase-like protein [Arthrobacter globiformis]|nr:transposase-like protein [Arthrobacter globiformis]
MPKPYPAEFRRDVVAVARKHEAPLAQIAKDFGISEATLHNWLNKADIEDGVSSGVTEKEAAELREAKKRIRLLEQENEILRRAAAFFARGAAPKMSFPLVLNLAAAGIPVAVTCRVLGFSKQAFYKWKANPVSDRDRADAHLINAALGASTATTQPSGTGLSPMNCRPKASGPGRTGAAAVQQPAYLVRFCQEAGPEP